MFNAKGYPVAPPGVFDAGYIEILLGDVAVMLVGNAVPRLLSELPQKFSVLRCSKDDGRPDPIVVAALAEENLYKEGVLSNTLTPLYLRAPEAKISVNGGRLKQ
jgi:hypothetical protein